MAVDDEMVQVLWTRHFLDEEKQKIRLNDFMNTGRVGYNYKFY